MTELLQPLDNLPYFTLQSVAQYIPSAPVHLRVLVSRWMKAGRIIQLKRGIYMSEKFFTFHRGDNAFSAMVSALLQPISYLSLEYVLQNHQILTEMTYGMSAITTKNTTTNINSAGNFTFRHIKPSLYTGYSLAEYFGVVYAVASVSKALFDYLYLRPLHYPIASPSLNYAEELRLNIDDWSAADREEFASYVEQSNSRKMRHILRNLQRNIWRH